MVQKIFGVFYCHNSALYSSRGHGNTARVNDLLAELLDNVGGERRNHILLTHLTHMGSFKEGKK